MSPKSTDLPPLVDHQTWRAALDELRKREKAATTGRIEEALAYKHKVGNRKAWYSSSQSPFAADMDAPPGGGFAVTVFLRVGDTVFRTWHTTGRNGWTRPRVGPRGRRTLDGWDSPDIARAYEPKDNA